MSPADMKLSILEVQAILELAMFRLVAKESLEADDVFIVEVALILASELLNPQHDKKVTTNTTDDLIQPRVKNVKK